LQLAEIRPRKTGEFYIGQLVFEEDEFGNYLKLKKKCYYHSYSNIDDLERMFNHQRRMKDIDSEGNIRIFSDYSIVTKLDRVAVHEVYSDTTNLKQTAVGKRIQEFLVNLHR
jgi:hypothetical protein